MGTFDTWVWVNVGAMVLAVFWGLVWAVGGIRARRNDVVDVSWGMWIPLMALLVGGAVVFPAPTDVPRAAIVLSLVLLWGARLSWHVARRQLAHADAGLGEDTRYATWRKRFGRHELLGSVLGVFVAQPLLAVVVAQPVLIAVAVATGRDVGLWWLDGLAFAVVVAGILIEGFAGLRLRQFLARRERGAEGGRYLTSGLWAWSRHPNYAGDAIVWIGLGLFGISAAIAGGQVWLLGPSIGGPLLMWLFLRYGTGVPVAERGRAGDAEWDAYVTRTSTFWLRPPRRSG